MALTRQDEAVRRLAAIVASSDDAIVSKDLNGIVRTWNVAAERLFGYTEAEMIGQSILQIIPDERKYEEDEVLRRIRRGERVEHFETFRRRKDGSLIPVSLTVSPIFGENNEIIGASKIARDISDRRRAEEALARLEADRAELQRRLLTLVAASQSVVGRGVVSDVLTAAMTLASDLIEADGYVMWRLRGDKWDPARSMGVSEAFVDVGRPTTSDGRPIAPPAEPLAVPDVSADPFLAPRLEAYRREGVVALLLIPLRIAGELSGSLVFYYRQPHHFSDVEVQTAVALGNLAAAGIAAAELQEQERAAREEARQANLIKDQFLATLSHELRTPLNAMVGYTRMMLRGVVDAERQQHALTVIERNGTALAQIVEDVLDVSRIASAKLAIKQERLDLAPLVHHAVETLAPQAADRGITLKTQLTAESAPVLGDANRLQQVVWNLISNALKFTRAGGTVVVSLEREGPSVTVAVEDTGVGIAAEFLSLIFEPFRQADPQSREQGGLGLGLAITRRLVELHGGTISATSEGEGKGSRFVVVLPVLES